MSRSKIVHLTSVHHPFDTRIFYKECRSLADAGYDVVLIAPYDGDEQIDGIQIRGVPIPRGRNERLRKTTWQVYRTALREDGDVYHFHDPELIPVGMLLKAHRKKVVYDVHEDLSLQVFNKDYLGGYGIKKALSLAIKMVHVLSGYLFDGIVGAIPEITNQFPEKKSVTLNNYPLLKLIDNSPPVEMASREENIVIYVGGLTRIRGVCEMIQAVSNLEGTARLWLFGPWISEEFRTECEEQPGWRFVYYGGKVPLEQVYSNLKIADVGLAVLHPRINYLTSKPVKAFEYMACSLPMVMSDFPYWREVFKGAALFVDPQDPEAIAGAIRRLLEHPDEARRLGERGRQMVEETYSWEAESAKLLALYGRILHS